MWRHERRPLSDNSKFDRTRAQMHGERVLLPLRCPFFACCPDWRDFTAPYLCVVLRASITRVDGVALHRSSNGGLRGRRGNNRAEGANARWRGSIAPFVNS